MTLEGEYLGSAPKKNVHDHHHYQLYRIQNSIISPISKHMFFKKLMSSYSKRSYLQKSNSDGKSWTFDPREVYPTN